MSGKSAIDELLAIAKKKRAELKQELKMLNESIAHLEKLLSPQQLTIPDTLPKTMRFRNKTAIEAAEAVLREHGSPMHLNEIVSAVIDGGYEKHTNKYKLYSNLFPALSRRRKDLFAKIEGVPATFGLVEWEKEKEKP
jgi:hypothetical protein